MNPRLRNALAALSFSALVLVGCDGPRPDPNAEEVFLDSPVSIQHVEEHTYLMTDMETGCQYYLTYYANGQEFPRIGTDGLHVCGGDQQFPEE